MSHRSTVDVWAAVTRLLCWNVASCWREWRKLRLKWWHGEQCGRITGVEATWFCTRQGNTQGRQTELPAASTTTKCTNLTANYFLQKHVQLMLVSCFLFRAETLQHCSISFYLQSAMSTSLCQISPEKWHLRGLYEIGAALRAPVTATWKSKTCQPRLEMDSPFAPLSTNTGLTWCK